MPASCTVNGILCERHPQIVTAAAKRGWELIAHNYIQTEFLINYRDDRAKEREVLKRTIDLIEKTAGRRPKGWLSSSLRCTVNTSDILKELGLTYHCDYMNDEQPYLINTAHGPLVSIPYTQEANDIGMFLRRNLIATEAFQLMEGRVRRALPRRREERTDHEHRPASAHHRPRVPRPGAARVSRLREDSSTACGGRPARRSRTGISPTTRATSAETAYSSRQACNSTRRALRSAVATAMVLLRNASSLAPVSNRMMVRKKYCSAGTSSPRREPRQHLRRAVAQALAHHLHDAAARLLDGVARVELDRAVAAHDLPVGAADHLAAHLRALEMAAGDLHHAALAERAEPMVTISPTSAVSVNRNSKPGGFIFAYPVFARFRLDAPRAARAWYR